MTRKEMIAACIDDQITRGIVKAEQRELQIKWHLKGYAGCKGMSKSECQRWYDAMFNK